MLRLRVVPRPLDAVIGAQVASREAPSVVFDRAYLFWYDDNRGKSAGSLYKSSSGYEPARDWLKNLSKAGKKILGEDIATVQYGWPVGMPLVRKMEPNLWELRSRLCEGIARTFFTIHGNEIVLLHGFVKKSARTPKDELEVARKRMKEVRNA